MTCFKMAIAGLLMIPAAFSVEKGKAWTELGRLHWEIQVLVAAGILITMAFQSSVVGLTSYTLATTGTLLDST